MFNCDETYQNKLFNKQILGILNKNNSIINGLSPNMDYFARQNYI